MPSLVRSVNRLAKLASRFAARPASFVLSCVLVAGWLVSGPLFDYSDTWQLAINTATTVVTFLMVFLIQNTQARDTGLAAMAASRAPPPIGRAAP